jgi:phosphohistidine phosphatase
MRVFIIRHGSAFPISDKYNEENRPLTEEGHKETKKIGSYLSRFNIQFDIIWSSPYLRAIQTKENIFSSQSNFEFEILNELKPQENPEKVVNKVISQVANDKIIGIVGHQPQIGKILFNMLNTKPHIFDILPSTLIEVDILDTEKNRFEYKLKRFLHPRDI